MLVPVLHFYLYDFLASFISLHPICTNLIKLLMLMLLAFVQCAIVPCGNFSRRPRPAGEYHCADRFAAVTGLCA